MPMCVASTGVIGALRISPPPIAGNQEFPYFGNDLRNADVYDAEANRLWNTPHVLRDGIQECHDDALSTHRSGAGHNLALPIDGQDGFDIQESPEECLAPADPARRQEAVERLDREHDARLISDAVQLLDDLISGHGHLCGLQHQEPLE